MECQRNQYEDEGEAEGDAPLAGGLEEEPLELVDLVLGEREGELVRRVILVDEVGDDRVGLPAILLCVRAADSAELAQTTARRTGIVAGSGVKWKLTRW